MKRKMNWRKISDNLSMENKGLHHSLSVAFAFFFLFPLLGFAYFILKYDLLQDNLIPFVALALLISALAGYNIIRKIFDDIRTTSQGMEKTIAQDLKDVVPVSNLSETQGIIQSFRTLEKELLGSFRKLDRRVSQISILKELSDLCYVTFDTEDLFYVTLERAMKLADADIGSVLILEQPKRESFIMQANIGHEGRLSKGDRIAFADSIAKYAVINKSPLLVDDIETDFRFARSNRAQYGARAFLCMPLKGIKEVIGVLNLSRRESSLPFTQDDIAVLSPLLSSAAFTYDNLALMKKYEAGELHLKVLNDLHAILTSSLRDSERLQALLKKIREDVPCDVAMILVENENNPGHMSLAAFLADMQVSMPQQKDYPYADTVLEQVLKQRLTININNPSQLPHPVEQELFLSCGLHSCLLYPLTAGDIKGVLAMGLLRGFFDGPPERNEALANLLALAMEKDRLSASIIKRDQEMTLIKQIGSLLAASTFDMQEVLGHTMDLIRATLEVEAGSLLLLEKDELTFNVSFNVKEKGAPDALKNLRLKLGQGIAGYCATRGEPIMVRNALESKQFSPEFDKRTGFSTRSVLCVPLISQSRVIGVIQVINKLGGDFNDNDMRLLQSIATTVSIALENARLYQETLSATEHERSIRSMFQKFVPKEIVDKIIHDNDGGRPPANELKTITLMNIDIRGFSLLARTLGSQKTVAILNHFFGIMGEIVFKHGGIVDKYLGDGFLALFGAPVSDIHDADHAVAAALEMQASIGSINDHFVGELERPIITGISVHTGEAVVGNIGFEKRMDYTVIGDSVNAVFKIQEMTRSLPNGILISEKTLRALCDTHPEVRERDVYNSGEFPEALMIYEVLCGQG
ncbi:MAG: GAF domain-containing protein [Syntrophales bacterium]